MRSFTCLLGTVLVAFLATTGCVQTAMLPAHQLDGGETVVATSIDEPGAAWIPRLNVQATQGFGQGDLTVNFGGTIAMLGGGLSGRYYLSDGVNAEIQVQGAAISDDWGGTVLAGIQQTATDASPCYFGIHGGALSGEEINVNLPDEYYDRHTVPLIGGTVGMGHVELGSHWRLQVELEANVPIPVTEEGAGLPPARLTIGFLRLWQ